MTTYSVFTSTGLALTQLCERDFEHFMTWIQHTSIVRVHKTVSAEAVLVLYDEHTPMNVPAFLKIHSYNLTANDIFHILRLNWKP